MYLKKVHIQNIRSIADLTWQVEEDNAAGWHVILGDNGAGKSSFIRSIAIALIGPNEASKLLEDWGQWLPSTAMEAAIDVNLVYDKLLDKIRKPEDEEDARVQSMLTTMESMHLSAVRRVEERIYSFPSAKILLQRREGFVDFGWEQPVKAYDPAYSVWSKEPGWFSAAYGPFRRFSGGDTKYDNAIRTNPKLARCLSAFDESIALTDGLRWLKDLQFKKLEGNPEGSLLDLVKCFINQPGFLPHGVQLESVTSSEVKFIDGNTNVVLLENLSDGYRSILSMTFELIRQLAICYGPDKVFDPGDPTKIIVPGVVLIDEVDAHLHPTWQRRIGVWFRTHFPNIQFIVTTHSPLVCQAAEHGTVYKLPTPGTNEEGHMIEGAELNRLLYGNILEAYSTEAFGSGITRSEASRQRTKRLAELNRKELHGELTEAEEQEQNDLRAMLPTTAHILSEEAAV